MNFNLDNIEHRASITILRKLRKAMGERSFDLHYLYISDSLMSLIERTNPEFMEETNSIIEGVHIRSRNPNIVIANFTVLLFFNRLVGYEFSMVKKYPTEDDKWRTFLDSRGIKTSL